MKAANDVFFPPTERIVPQPDSRLAAIQAALAHIQMLPQESMRSLSIQLRLLTVFEAFDDPSESIHS